MSPNNVQQGQRLRLESQQQELPVQTIAQYISDQGISFRPEELHEPDPERIRVVLIQLLWKDISKTQQDIQIVDDLIDGGRKFERCFLIITKILLSWGVTTFCYDDWTNPTFASLIAVLSRLIARKQKVAEEMVKIEKAFHTHAERNKVAQESILGTQRVENELSGRLKMLQALEELGNVDGETYRGFISEQKEVFKMALRQVKATRLRTEELVFQSAHGMSMLEKARNNLQL